MDARLEVSEEQIRQEWAAALGLNDLAEDGEDIKTTGDLMEMFGCSRSAADGRAIEAVKRGDMERTKVKRISQDGRMRILIAYRLVKK